MKQKLILIAAFLVQSVGFLPAMGGNNQPVVADPLAWSSKLQSTFTQRFEPKRKSMDFGVDSKKELLCSIDMRVSRNRTIEQIQVANHSSSPAFDDAALAAAKSVSGDAALDTSSLPGSQNASSTKINALFSSTKGCVHIRILPKTQR